VNAWSCNPIPPYDLMLFCLIKRREKFRPTSFNLRGFSCQELVWRERELDRNVQWISIHKILMNSCLKNNCDLFKRNAGTWWFVIYVRNLVRKVLPSFPGTDISVQRSSLQSVKCGEGQTPILCRSPWGPFIGHLLAIISSSACSQAKAIRSLCRPAGQRLGRSIRS
jgi:hypothetical protein